MVTGPAEISVLWGAVPPGGEIGVTVWKAVGKWLTTAGIVISQGQAGPFLATVLRHELGHALGLGHAGHPNEIMYPTVGKPSPTDYQAGDIAGLHAIGASQGC
jgi:predicted Zn-dependent protease